MGGRREVKTNTVFKRAHNQWLSRLGGYRDRSDIGSEPLWAETLAVSRTTVRAVLAALAAEGIVAIDGRRKVLLRRPVPADLYPDSRRDSSAPSSKSGS